MTSTRSSLLESIRAAVSIRSPASGASVPAASVSSSGAGAPVSVPGPGDQIAVTSGVYVPTGHAGTYRVRCLSARQATWVCSIAPIAPGTDTYIETTIESLGADASIACGLSSSQLEPTLALGHNSTSVALHIPSGMFYSKGNEYDVSIAPSVMAAARDGTRQVVIGVGTTNHRQISSGDRPHRYMYYITVDGRVVYSGPCTLAPAAYFVWKIEGDGVTIAVNCNGPFQYAADREGRGARADSVTAAPNRTLHAALLSRVRAVADPRQAALAPLMSAHFARRHSEAGNSVSASSPALSLADREPTEHGNTAGSAGAAAMSGLEHALEVVRNEMAMLSAERDALLARARMAEAQAALANVEELEALRLKTAVCEGQSRALTALSDEALEDALAAARFALARMEEERGRRDQCVCCMSARKSIVYLPCKHFAMCRRCDDRVDKCPICRQVIKDRLNVYS